MQIFKLNQPSYLPGDTYQKFNPDDGDTLVWTERYQVAGDFKLEVENEVSILTKFPLGTLISHTDTTEVMMVENHEIDRTDKGLKITVSGRTFETFAENRNTVGWGPLVDSNDNPNAPYIAPAPASSIATEMLSTNFVTGHTDDIIPNVLVYEDMRFLDDDMDHIVKRESVYSSIMNYLRLCDAGIKTVRPNGAQTTMDVVIHDGADRRNSIIFYAQNEDLGNAKYFWSIKNYKNYVLIATKVYARLHRHRDILTDLTGLDRREMYAEANDLEESYEPSFGWDVLSSRGQAELDNHQKVALLQATISKSARPKFKFDYDVGDLVTVFGEFGVAQYMRVTEHILTVDKDGIRGYPSLNIL